MAKAKRTKYISKGQRKNSKLKAAAPKPQVGNDNNAMRQAFLDTPFTDSVRFSRMGAIIIRAVQATVKRTPVQVRGWSANLSFRTYKALQTAGVLA